MPKTIIDFARELAAAFETKTRDNGDSFLCLKDDRPEWAQDVAHECHGDMMPDDWRYAAIYSAADALSRADDPDDLDDLGAEWADGNVDVYNAARLQWLASSFDRLQYADDAAAEFGFDPKTGILGLIGMGQYMESQEIWGQLVAALGALADDEPEDESEAVND